MPQTITFENALKLKDAGISHRTEKAYRYGVEEKKTEAKERKGGRVRTVTEQWEEWDGKPPKFDDWDQAEFNLSNRFTDSWTDALASAYNVVEIAKFFKKLGRINAAADPNTFVEKILELYADGTSKS